MRNKNQITLFIQVVRHTESHHTLGTFVFLLTHKQKKIERKWSTILIAGLKIMKIRVYLSSLYKNYLYFYLKNAEACLILKSKYSIS
jgi:hypothetical protein